MVSIDVDFDVFKELTIRRKSEEMTENEVIRELLGIQQYLRPKESKLTEADGTPWVTKGVSFPHGSEFRTNYKGKEYLGRVQNGALVVNGKRYSSPSAAAVAVTGNSVNGWRFWECKLPSSSRWRSAASLRK